MKKFSYIFILNSFKEAYISAKKAVIEAESERDFLKNNPKSIKEEFHQTVLYFLLHFNKK